MKLRLSWISESATRTTFFGNDHFRRFCGEGSREHVTIIVFQKCVFGPNLRL